MSCGAEASFWGKSRVNSESLSQHRCWVMAKCYELYRLMDDL